MWDRAVSKPLPDTRSLTRAAVLDVGSNSVRLVAYRLDGRSIWTVYNEKVLAGLGRDLGRTGKLSEGGVVQARAALRRFRALLGDDGVVFTAATAAVRDARDGPAFADAIRRETGFALRVLSGEEEARYAALGVAAGDPLATGVVGDLGGSSLELTPIDMGVPGKGRTFAVGPFALGDLGDDRKAIRAEVERRMEGADAFAAETFHAVGGAWRNLALIHMRLTSYPLEIVHQYGISATDALETARFIARQSKGSLERMGGASKKRADTLPYAAAVMEAVIERLGVRQVEFSAFGLREGLLFEAMGAETRARDPLIEGMAALDGRWAEAEAFGAALEDWIAPAFAALPPIFGEDRDRVMIAAACRIAELGSRLHPDQRATLAFEQVLRAPVPGQTHAERAFLASAIFARHTAIADPPEGHVLARTLNFDGQRRAKALGAAVRLACDLCGRNAALLQQATLAIEEEAVVLSTAETDLLLSSQTRRRAQTLAQALGRRLEIR
jgi:exopolyphosphatase/guanosine-5'-triphosphate,3'-diphosphate pyrophosphatase